MDSETQAIRDWLREHSISEVECLVPDMTGNARGKFIPAPQYLASGQPRLPEGILIQSVTGQYCEEHWDLVEPTDSDMILKPDITTMRVVPWAREPTAQIIHDCYTRGGELHPLSTRNVLRRVLDLYAQQGLQPVVAPEVEFFLVAKNTDPDYELSAPQGRSGRAETSRRSYSIDAVAEFEDFVEDIYDYAEAQGLQVGALIHEDGAAQMEMNFEHGDPMSLADQVFVFKRTVRETAHKYGMYATFMAKPMQRETGSAMHIHQSVLRTATGENIFSDGKGGFSDTFLSYIAGLQHYTPQLISLYAPNVNSYRRLAPEVAAPINLYWGVDNRTTGFRVPRSPADATRIENRFPGADVNPYLAFAATLASGYLGMQKKLVPTEPHQGTANEDADVEVVRTLEEGLRHLQEAPEVREILGDLFLRAYSAVKRQEFEEFNRVISSWEREHLLLQV
ncbi:MAG: glutamine synthetase [Haliea sp.]|jgi:glutamine synthetase|nr:glutamine synthetase [Haliea sp.]MBK6739202.1 glutamine synthetase [Haliea sp.]